MGLRTYEQTQFSHIGSISNIYRSELYATTLFSKLSSCSVTITSGTEHTPWATRDTPCHDACRCYNYLQLKFLIHTVFCHAFTYFFCLPRVLKIFVYLHRREDLKSSFHPSLIFSMLKSFRFHSKLVKSVFPGFYDICDTLKVCFY